MRIMRDLPTLSREIITSRLIGLLQVIDEADRLLAQSFQNWLPTVLAHNRPPTSRPAFMDEPGFERQSWDSVAPAWLPGYGLIRDDWEGYEAPKSTVSSSLAVHGPQHVERATCSDVLLYATTACGVCQG